MSRGKTILLKLKVCDIHKQSQFVNMPSTLVEIFLLMMKK